MAEKPTYEELEKKIQEFEQVESERKRVEERLNKIVDNTQDAIFIHDLEGNILDVNEKMCAMYKTSKEQACSLSIQDFSSSNMSMDVALQRWSRVLKGEKLLFEWEALRPHNGSVFYVEVSLQRISFFEKDIILANVRDITDRKRAEEALSKSERRYRLLADNVNDVIWIRDMNLRFTYISPSIMEQQGYTVEEAMARTPEEIWSPDSLKYIGEVLTEELEIEKQEKKDLTRSRTLEVEVKCKDGSTIWTEAKMSFLRDQNDYTIGIIGVTRDISERKQAEEKLRDSEHKLRVSEKELKSVINNTPDIIYRLDSNGNILFVNQSVKEYGYSIEELIGKNILELVHPDDREKAIYRINERRTGDRRTKSFEIRLLTKDLTTVPFETRASGFGSFLIDAEGIYSTEKPNRDSFEGTQGIARDISERKRAEEALLESEEKHRLFFENAPIGIIHYNSEGIITAINNAMIATFGSSREKLVGLKIDDIPDKKFAKEVYESLNGKMGYYEGEYTSYTGGKPAIIRANWIPIVSGGEVISGVGIVEDITDRKQAAEEREKLINELQTAFEEVNTLRGIIPICSHCKKIRDDEGYWQQVEKYIQDRSEAEFSHSICHECAKKLYPDLDIHDD